MLTIEMLKQNSALTGLTDAQLGAIAEMSKNDENTVIGSKIGELHGQYDTDIFNVTGIKKNNGEKSYDYAKRILSEYKTKAESITNIQKELDKARNEVTELTNKLANNAGDEVLQQQLKDSQNQVTQLQATLKTKESEYAKKEADLQSAIKNVHVDYAFEKATSGIKFKSGITEPVQKTLIKAAKSEILAKGTPELVEQNGENKIVLRDSNGNILNNPKNNLNPYTIQELILETSLKDVIDHRREVSGGGTGGNGGNGGNSGGTLDLSGIKNQIEADKAIENYLLQNGITRDSQEFADQSLKLRSENNVSDLPIR